VNSNDEMIVFKLEGLNLDLGVKGESGILPKKLDDDQLIRVYLP
jgi:hypothetical protein